MAAYSQLLLGAAAPHGDELNVHGRTACPHVRTAWTMAKWGRDWASRKVQVFPCERQRNVSAGQDRFHRNQCALWKTMQPETHRSHMHERC